MLSDLVSNCDSPHFFRTASNLQSIFRIRGEALKELLDGFSERLRVSERTGRCVDKRRAAKCLFGLTLPYALAASALTAWRESFQPNPSNFESAVRLLLIGLGFMVIFFLLYRAIVRPAMLDYVNTLQSESDSSDEEEADNHEIHAKHGIGFLQMEITMAVLGDLGRSPTYTATIVTRNCW